MTAPAMASAAAIYREARAVYRPRARRPVVEWAETERVLSTETSAEAGRYSLARTPWWREVLETMADEVTERVVVVKSAQVGWTELLNTFLGFTMAEDPGPTLVIQPTVEMAESWSKERLAPMLRDTPALRGILRSETRGMARSADDTLRLKKYAGGFTAIIGANSPASLASRPIRRVLADEVDRWPVSAGAEGDPLELAGRRTTTFWNRKIAIGSTPTIEDASPTWSRWLESDQRRWLVPCPHCGHRQQLRYRDDTGAYLLVCDRDADGRLLPETAQYRCEGCAALIDERDKAAMVAAGAWVPLYPERPVRGYHISALYSPWQSWAAIVAEHQLAKASAERLQVFVNTVLGEPFSPPTEAADPHVLAQRAEPLAGTVPPDVGLLTAGLDVQGDRVEVFVWGWADGERSIALAWHQVDGDPAQPETWQRVDEVLWAPMDGLTVTLAAVDTGFLTPSVWKWVDGQRGRAIGIKGMPGRGRPLILKPGATTDKRQRRPWTVGVDTAKDLLAARLRTAPEHPGGMRFSDALDPAFFDQLTAEGLRTVMVGGRPTKAWRILGNRRNEALDGAIYALAALHALGPAVICGLKDRAETRRSAPPAAAPAPPRDQFAPVRAAVPRRGGWVTGWKR